MLHFSTESNSTYAEVIVLLAGSFLVLGPRNLPLTATMDAAWSTPMVPLVLENMPLMSSTSVPRGMRWTKSLTRSRGSTLCSGGSSSAVGPFLASHLASSSAIFASSTLSCVPSARMDSSSSRLHRSASPGVDRGRFL